MAMYTPIIGLAVAVFALIFLVLRTRVHALIAMLIAASIAGITGGMGATQTVDAITKGFGSTLGSIGIVIGLGVMMGRVLEVSGAAEQIAYSFIKWLGKGARSGRWPSPAISSASRFSSIRRSSSFIRWSRRWRKGQAQPADARRRAGRRADPHHHAVPPTPGPLGVAGIFGVDIGAMMLAGLVLAIPCVIGIVLYARWLGARYPDFMPQEERRRICAPRISSIWRRKRARRCRA